MLVGREFHRNGAEYENERLPASSLTDGFNRVMTDVECVDVCLEDISIVSSGSPESYVEVWSIGERCDLVLDTLFHF